MSRHKFNHVHKYQQVKWGKNKTVVLKCMIAGCPHYIHKEMALNRKSICHGCGQPFVLDGYSVERKKPKCGNCIDHKKAPDLTSDKLAALLTDLD